MSQCCTRPRSISYLMAVVDGNRWLSLFSYFSQRIPRCITTSLHYLTALRAGCRYLSFLAVKNYHDDDNESYFMLEVAPRDLALILVCSRPPKVLWRHPRYPLTDFLRPTPRQ